MAEIHQYKCKNCLAKVQFDSESQMMKCPYCGSLFDVNIYIEEEKKEHEQLEEAIKEGKAPQNAEVILPAAPAPSPSPAPDSTKPRHHKYYNPELPPSKSKETAKYRVLNYDREIFISSGKKWDKDELGHMVVYRCETCGGEEVTTADTGSTRCPYCDHQMVISDVFEGDLQPELVVPFQVDKELAIKKYKEYITGRKFLPKVFKDQNYIEEIKGIYVPYWLFDSSMSATSNQTKFNKKSWVLGNYRYTKTTYFDVRREGEFEFKAVPADGSSKMPDDLMESIEPFDLAQAKDFSTVYLAGFMASRYDVPPKDCMDHVMYRMVESAYKQLDDSIETQYDGTSSKNNTFALHSGSIRYALLPVWLMNTKWQGKTYTFAMNGQTGKFVGDLPKDKTKIVLASMGLSTIFVIVLFIIFILIIHI